MRKLIASLALALLPLFVFVATNVFADGRADSSTILKLSSVNDVSALVDSVKEAKDFKDRALSTYVARKLARNYPFALPASRFLEAARNQNPQLAGEINGREFWFVPLTLLRILVILAALMMIPNFALYSIRTGIFSLLLFVVLVGEGINLNRGLFTSVFIPFEGEHFALSAPEAESQAVEKLPPGREIKIGEIKISEITGDWIKLSLPSGRVGWALTSDGVIESEDQ